jgi:3-deoxy-D-manno-octulosonate 8-phosphate phosphatase (KDO 8-P phosphatase)
MIKLIVLDVDGTLTDGGIYKADSGDEFRKFNAKDGLGILNAEKQGIEFAIITGSKGANIENRANHLKIKYVFTEVGDKLPILQQIMSDNNWSKENVAYIGDDVNDLECMQLCGYKACPVDAVDEVKAICNYVSSKAGGNGAVREVIDEINRTEQNRTEQNRTEQNRTEQVDTN